MDEKIFIDIFKRKCHLTYDILVNWIERGKNMKVRVDKETCVGDETCVDECPEIFEMQGDVAVAKMETVPKDLEKKVEEAAKNCPVEAIIIE